jgi:hypothetical protein
LDAEMDSYFLKDEKTAAQVCRYFFGSLWF